MRPFFYFVATSLDGFIARPDGAIDWLFHDQDYGFTEFLEGIDTVVMGRKTYEQSLTFGESPFKSKQHFIFSKTLTQSEIGTVVNEPVEQFVQHQRAIASPKGVWIIGGGELAGAFFAAQGIDQLIVFVHPVLIHAGLPLAAGVPSDVQLQLTGTHAFETGLVRLNYTVRSKPITPVGVAPHDERH